MKKEDLLRAVGHADERFLAELEQKILEISPIKSVAKTSGLESKS